MRVSLQLFTVATLLAAAGCQTGSVGGDDTGGGDDDVTGDVDAGSSGDVDARTAGNDRCAQLPATIRDFKIEHPDFEEPDGNSDFSYPGLVAVELGDDNTPVYAQ